MAIVTIPEAIERGKVSIYLAANNNDKGALFGRRLSSPGSPVTIAMVTDALNWGFLGGAQTDQDLREMANYLIWLIGKYGQQAQAILNGGGGGSVSPINPSNARPNSIQFEVGLTSFITTGSTSKQFPSSWKGYDIIFNRNFAAQGNIVLPDTTYYSWDINSAILTLYGPAPDNGAAQDTEYFQFFPV